MKAEPMRGAYRGPAGVQSLGDRVAILWLLTFLFALRVLAQAVQYWSPQPYLPPFDLFQGSSLPYWLLLSAQVVILVLMGRVSWRMQRGILPVSRRTGSALAWIGGIYMLGSLGRIAVGLTWLTAPHGSVPGSRRCFMLCWPDSS